MNLKNNNDVDDQQPPDTPWVIIPYWNGDRGRNNLERPLMPTPTPGSAVAPGTLSYACQSIEVFNGTPGMFTPGVPTTVAVSLRNLGKGAGIDLVNLDLWWSAPTTEFGNLTKLLPMAQANCRLVRDSQALQPPLVKNMTFVTPPAAGSHICVVVRATVARPLLPSGPSSSDGVPVWPANPTGDRHWGQRNLHRVVANSKGDFHLSFFTENIHGRDMPFRILANEVNARAAELLARELRATPRRADGAVLGLYPALAQRDTRDADQLREKGAALTVTIGANRRMAMVLKGTLEQPLAAGEFLAFEVMQVSERGANGHRQEANSGDAGTKRNGRTGTVGVVVFGPQR